MKCRSTLIIDIDLPAALKKKFEQSEELKESFFKMLTEAVVNAINKHVKFVVKKVTVTFNKLEKYFLDL